LNIYFIIYLILIFLAFFIDREKKQENQNFYIFLYFFVLVIFSSIRGEVGTDIGRYERDYNFIKNYNILELDKSFHYLPYEFLFSVIYVISGNLLKADFFLAKAMFSSIFFYGIYFFSKKINNFLITTIVLIPTLYFFIFFSHIRQGISISIGLICLVYFWEKKYLNALTAAFIASLFHKFAFIYSLPILILFLLENKKFLNSNILIVFVIFFLLFIFNMRHHLAASFDIYFLHQPYNHVTQYPIIKLFFLHFLYFFIYLIAHLKIKKINQLDIFITSFIIFCLLILPIFIIADVFVLRFYLYTLVLNPLIIYIFTLKFNKEKYSLVLLSLFFFNSIYLFLVLNFSAHAGSYLPYRLIF
jgi:hypothetical protein